MTPMQVPRTSYRHPDQTFVGHLTHSYDIYCDLKNVYIIIVTQGDDQSPHIMSIAEAKRVGDRIWTPAAKMIEKFLSLDDPSVSPNARAS